MSEPVNPKAQGFSRIRAEVAARLDYNPTTITDADSELEALGPAGARLVAGIKEQRRQLEELAAESKPLHQVLRETWEARKREREKPKGKEGN